MRRLTVRQRVEIWLHTYGHLFNKNAIEREICISRGTLQKYFKYDKKIRDQDIKELHKLIKEFHKFIKKNERI